MVQADFRPPDAEQPLLLFLLSGRRFGVEIDRVEQILHAQPITSTPRCPACVDGILEHRGRFLAVVSLRRRLGVSGPGPEHPAVLILRGIGPDEAVALVVDQALQMIRIHPDGLMAPPPRVFGIRAEYIRGVGNTDGHPLVWLDVRKLLTSDEPLTLQS